MGELLSKSNSKSRNSSDSPASVGRFLKIVELKEWWLIKAVEEEGSQKKSLGVAGFTNQRALRAFISAPILRTYDVLTLETVDGVTVKLSGLINKQRTKENGFPDEVFDHFVIGFPSFWETYVEKFFEGESGNEENSSVITPRKLFTDFEDLGECHEGTPNKDTKSHGKSRNTHCDNVDLNQAGGGSTLTKRVLRSSIRLSDASQCLDNYQEDNLKNNRKHLTISKATNCMDKGSSPAGEDSKNTKKILRSCNGPSDAKQNNGFNIEDSKKESNTDEKNANSKKKTEKLDDGSSPAETRRNEVSSHIEDRNKESTAEEENANSKKKTKRKLDDRRSPAQTRRNEVSSHIEDGNKKSTAEEENANSKKKSKSKVTNIDDKGSSPAGERITRSKVTNCDDKGSSPAGDEEVQLAKKKVDYGRSPARTRTKEVSPRIEDREKKSTAGEENSNSKKKYRKKLDYEKSPPQTGRNEESSVSPEISSLKKSRSGRKLLPSLEFWRNQKPVYDLDRNLTGIESPSPDS